MTAQIKQFHASRGESFPGRLRISTMVRRHSDPMGMQQIQENKQRTQQVEAQKQQQIAQEQQENEELKKQKEKKPNS